MVSDWIDKKLGDCFHLENGFAFKSREFIECGIPVIKIKNIKSGFFNEQNFSYVDKNYLAEKPDKVARINDILVSMSGNRHDGNPETWVGKAALFKKKTPYLINQRVAALRVIEETEVDSRFASYSLSSWAYQQWFISIATSSGGQANLSPKQILDTLILLPPLVEQKAIAHILGSLDDKIELNRHMNETLEAMAQALFKSWFVDFDPVIDNAFAAGNAIPDDFAERAEQRKTIERKDNADIQKLFPDEFEFTEEIGWIPRGWAVGKYSDLAELNPLSWSKKSMPEEISYVDLGNTNNGKIDLVVSYSSSEAPSRAKRVLSTDDTIIGTVRPGNRSFAFIHNEGLTGSTGFAVMKPIESINRTYIYLGLTQSIVIDYFAHIADGGAYPAINPSVVADLECIIPPSEVLEKFDDLAYCFLKKIGENSNHNETLAKIRDTLLPKLMSGELRIPDANALVDEAV